LKQFDIAGVITKKGETKMRMRNLFTLRRALKDPKTAKKLVDEVNKEVASNERKYKEKDKQLKDLLEIISSAQSIINKKPEF